jgi:hypothetical protein
MFANLAALVSSFFLLGAALGCAALGSNHLQLA